jgi:hypothetical protein
MRTCIADFGLRRLLAAAATMGQSHQQAVEHHQQTPPGLDPAVRDVAQSGMFSYTLRMVATVAGALTGGMLFGT